MIELTDKKKKKLEKFVKLELGDKNTIIEELFSLESGIEKNTEDIQEIKDKINTIKDGKDYVLTDFDKVDIANKIQVPVVNKVIERVREIPVVRETIKETIKINNDPVIENDINVIKKQISDIQDKQNEPKQNITIGGNRPLKVLDNGTDIGGAVTELNFINASSISALGVSKRRINITLPTSGPGFQVPISGVVDGVNRTFTWATAPNALCVDQGRAMQAVSSDGNENWTGTTTTVLQIAPVFDIFAIA